MYKLYIFDLDGTLAPSKMPLQTDMAKILCDTMKHSYVAIVSGASFSQFKKQFLPQLSELCASCLANLVLMPTNGAEIYRYEKGDWEVVYSKPLTEEAKQTIFSSLKNALVELGIPTTAPHGELIEDRKTQITYSGLGQQAPLAEKEMWDPDHSKRAAIISKLETLKDTYEIHSAGATSIDVTQKGIDKEFACLHVLELLGITPSEAVFTGDATYPGGNDEPATKVPGLHIYKTTDPDDTLAFLRGELESA